MAALFAATFCVRRGQLPLRFKLRVSFVVTLHCLPGFSPLQVAAMSEMLVTRMPSSLPAGRRWLQPAAGRNNV
eukprot:360999-Chlamydomonas_euryale.AAC.12